MSTPHSLTFSNPAFQPEGSRRGSLSQLPLPATLTQRPLSPISVNTVGSEPPTPSSPAHFQGTSSAFSKSRGDMFAPNTHNLSSFRSPVSHTSSTHAGGIQPSASFFRPSRPSQIQEYSRPSSAASLQETPRDADGFPLSALPKRRSIGSDTHDGSGPDSAPEEHNISSMKSLKQSREGLLPIGERPIPLTSRSSITRDRGAQYDANPLSSARHAGRLVRSSLDMVITLGRGLSFDSARKSPTTPRHTLDGKLHDEEQAIPSSPISRYKEPSSPGHFSNSLNVTATRHSMHPSPSPSPDPSFIAIPPHDQSIQLSTVPIIDEKTRKSVRNYQVHPSRNRFFFGGRLLTGGDSPWAFIASFTVVMAIAGVWFGTTCVWWWKNESPAVAAVGAYMALIVITTMLSTAFTDPGILPRNLDPDPPYPATSPSDGGVRAPMPRDLKVRADVVRVKYCPTCRTYRPPRSSHCKMCDNCVDGCDHHCQWVNNCVGRRNYTSFFVLLFSATLTLVLIICTSALHLYFLTQREDVDFKHALQRGAGSAVAFSLSIAVIWPVAALLSYHMRLLLLNITTIEQIRNQAHKTLVPGPAPPNPFSHGSWRRNLVSVLCRPMGYSWLDASAVATEDKRAVNPGLSESVWTAQRDPETS